MDKSNLILSKQPKADEVLHEDICFGVKDMSGGDSQTHGSEVETKCSPE